MRIVTEIACSPCAFGFVSVHDDRSVKDLEEEFDRTQKRVVKAAAPKPRKASTRPMCSTCHAVDGHNKKTCHNVQLLDHSFEDCLHPDLEEQKRLHKKELKLAEDRVALEELKQKIVCVAVCS